MAYLKTPIEIGYNYFYYDTKPPMTEEVKSFFGAERVLISVGMLSSEFFSIDIKAENIHTARGATITIENNVKVRQYIWAKLQYNKYVMIVPPMGNDSYTLVLRDNSE